MNDMNESPSEAPPGSAPPHPDAGPAKRLRRDPNGSVGGVSSGIANYLDVDPTIVKLAVFALMFLSGGTLFLAYLAAWILVPTSTDPDPRQFAITNKTGPIILGTIVLVAAMSTWFAEGGPGGSLVLPTLLVGGGVFLLSQRENATLNPPADPRTQGFSQTPGSPTTSVPAPPIAGSEPSTYNWAVPRLDAESPPPTPPHAEPAVPRPPVAAVTLAAAAVVIGVLAVVGQFPGVDMGARAYFGAATAVIGIGLIVSSVIGRAWRLIPLGFIAASLAFVGPIADGASEGGFGPKEIVVTTEAELLPSYSVGGGYVELDMRQLRITEDRTVVIEVGGGYSEILVPSGTNLRIEADSNFGYVNVFGREVAGVDNSYRSNSTSDEDGPTLTIKANTEFGYVEVTR